MWDDPRLRIKSEVDRVLILHLLQTLSQVRLSGDSGHGWEVIYLLEGLELAELLREDRNVVPDQVNVGVACHFVLLRLLQCGLLDLLLRHVLLAGIFLRVLVFAVSLVVFISALLCGDYFPFHFKGTLSQ